MPRKLRAHDFDRMLLLFLAQRVELLAAAAVLRNPFSRELAALNVGQSFLHRRARSIAHHLFAARQVAIFRGVRNGVAHPAQSTFVDQVDDQLGLVQTLEVRNLRRVASLDQRFESFLDQRGQPAAQHGLLAEQVALGFFLESRLQNSRAGRADAMRIGQREFVRVAAGILLDRDQRRHPAPFAIHAPHQVSRDSWARSSPRPRRWAGRWS